MSTREGQLHGHSDLRSHRSPLTTRPPRCYEGLRTHTPPGRTRGLQANSGLSLGAWAFQVQRTLGPTVPWAAPPGQNEDTAAEAGVPLPSQSLPPQGAQGKDATERRSQGLSPEGALPAGRGSATFSLTHWGGSLHVIER